MTATPEPGPLPIEAITPEVLAAVREGHNVVLVAPPGTGKTTRIPLALLDAVPGEVWVLCPRRLAARMAARHVAAALREPVGGRVGSRVRFEDQTGPDTRLVFMTERMVLQRLRTDRTLSSVGVLVFDEFHERHLDSDLALALARELRHKERPDLRIVVMSATLEAEGVAKFLDARRFEVSARTFPVSLEYAAEDARRPLESRLLAVFHNLVRGGLTGDVLAFLPGQREIALARRACEGVARAANIEVVALHGDLEGAEQDRAVQPSSRRKLVLSTNVAESSVTVEAVTVVVDSGLARIPSYDPWSGISSLTVTKVARASAIQRMGRAGRLREGHCVRLFGSDDFARRPAFEVPEIRRLDLATACLDLAGLGIVDPQAFAWFEAPDPAQLASAQGLLRRLGAIDASGRLLPVGREMLRLPLAPRLARMLVEAKTRGIPRFGARAAAICSEGPIRRRSPATQGTSHAPRPRSHADGRGELFGDLDDLAAFERGADAETLGISNSACRRVLRVASDLGRALSTGGRTNAAAPPSPRSPARHSQATQGSLDEAAERDEALVLCVLTAFPDRVAKHLGDGRLAFAEGGSAELSPDSACRNATWVVAMSAERRREGPRGDRVLVRDAVEVDALSLLEACADAIDEVTLARFDPERERVTSVREVRYGQLTLERQLLERPSPEVDTVFREALAGAPLSRFYDEHKLETLSARLALVRGLGHEVPELGHDAARSVLFELANGLRSFRELTERGPMAVLEAKLSPTVHGLLRRLAPERVTLSRGREVTVQYSLAKPAYVESRLQDFFGMPKGPCLGGGAVPLVVHLLAPNRRPVSVTSDLASFWRNHYPSLRRELSRKYPRHAWPEDPLSSVGGDDPAPARRR